MNGGGPDSERLGLESLAKANASLGLKVDRLMEQQDEMMKTLALMLREKEDERRRDEERRELNILLAEREKERERGEPLPILLRDVLSDMFAPGIRMACLSEQQMRVTKLVCVFMA